MEYVNDENEMHELMEAASQIKDWASEQMGSMRRPHKPSECDPGEEMEVMMSEEPDHKMEMSDLQQPMDEPPPRDFGKPVTKQKTVMEVIEPGVGMSSRMAPRAEEAMEDIAEDVQKLGKFGKKYKKY